MGRLPRGQEMLSTAQQELAKTKDIEEIRVLQAVIFPLANKMSIQQTAKAVGRSPSWVTKARNKYIREGGFKKSDSPPIRNHAFMPLEEEKAFLAPFIEKARPGGILVVSEIHLAMQKHLGREVALSTAYNLLHRHGWRKLVPDKRNIASDPQVQEEWKKKLPERLSQIEKEWDAPGQIRLMFQDEARFGRIAESRRCWCPKPERPVCPTIVSQEYAYAYGAVRMEDGQWDSLILPEVNTKCMQIFLNEISNRYPNERIVMVLDGAGWHRSKTLKIPPNIKLLPLPAYSPELNPVENIWEELREKFFHNRVFSSLDAVEEQLLRGLNNLESNPQITHSISSWPWIIKAVLK